MKDLESIRKLFQDVNMLLKAQEELEVAKKDKFNIFDVLKLDSNETRTHSAFIAELLDPKGSHLMGELFLRDFVDIVLGDVPFDTTDCVVSVEKGIGKISEDRLRGGRLDILISNSKGQSITIENKIYSKQGENQITRYLNYNKGLNHVLLLTLTSCEIETPGEFQELAKNITYQDGILIWLERCYLKAIDYPILRENLKQYIRLIEKLVEKLDDNRMNEELKSMIVNNIAAARSVAANYSHVLDEIKIQFQQEVYSLLKQRQWDGFEVEMGRLANQTNAQIWITPNGYRDKGLWFGIQTFSGKSNFGGQFFVGIISLEEKVPYPAFAEFIREANRKGWWYDIQDLKDQYGKTIDFSDDEFVAGLAMKRDYRLDLKQAIVAQVTSYWSRKSVMFLTALTAGANA